MREPRPLTMQDRLLVAAHVETIAMREKHYRVIADAVMECVRCCDSFPECSHVLAEGERVDREEGRESGLVMLTVGNIAVGLCGWPQDPEALTTSFCSKHVGHDGPHSWSSAA